MQYPDKKHLKHGSKTLGISHDLLLQHQDETITMYIKNFWNTRNIQVRHRGEEGQGRLIPGVGVGASDEPHGSTTITAAPPWVHWLGRRRPKAPAAKAGFSGACYGDGDGRRRRRKQHMRLGRAQGALLRRWPTGLWARRCALAVLVVPGYAMQWRSKRERWEKTERIRMKATCGNWSLSDILLRCQTAG